MEHISLEQDKLPDITNNETGSVLISQWLLDDPDEQAKAADATIREWQNAPIPEEFLSLYAFLNIDNPSVLYYAQWKNDEGHKRFVADYRPTLIRGIDRDIQNVTRPGLTRYRLLRSLYGGNGNAESKDYRILVITLEFYTVQGCKDWLVKNDSRHWNHILSHCPKVHIHGSADGLKLLFYIPMRAQTYNRSITEKLCASETIRSFSVDRYRLYKSIQRR